MTWGHGAMVKPIKSLFIMSLAIRTFQMTSFLMVERLAKEYDEKRPLSVLQRPFVPTAVHVWTI